MLIPNRAVKVRGTYLESNNTPPSTVRIPAIALPVVSIMDAVPDILCRGTAIRDVNVECLRWAVAHG